MGTVQNMHSPLMRRQAVKEYKVVTHRGGSFTAAKSEDLEATLNKYAAKGWRVVNTVSVFNFASGNSLVSVLEREVN